MNSVPFKITGVSSVPGVKENELRLGCRRRYWEAATQLASSLNMRIIDHDLNEMADGVRPAAPPPPRS